MKTLSNIAYQFILVSTVFVLLAAQGCVQVEPLPVEALPHQFLAEADQAYQKGKYRKALNNCEEAIRAAEQIEDQQRRLYVNDCIVETCEKLSRHEEVLPLPKELTDLFAGTKQEQTKKAEVDALLKGAKEASARSDHKEALNKVEEAQKIYKTMEGATEKSNLVWGVFNDVMRDLYEDEKALVELGQQVLTIIELVDAQDHAAGQYLGRLGEVYANAGQDEKALQHYQQALAIARKLGNTGTEEVLLYQIGKLHEKQGGQYETALEFYQQERVRRKKAGDSEGEVEALYSIERVYEQLGQYEKALKVAREILTIQRTSGSLWNIGIALTCTGSLYQYLAQYEKAMDFHQQALAIYAEMGGTIGMSNAANVLDSIGYIYKKLGQSEKAVVLQQQALMLSLQAEAAHMIQEAKRLEAQYGENLEAAGLSEQVAEFYQLAEAAMAGKGQNVPFSLITIAESYQTIGQNEKALTILQQALAIARENTERDLQPFKKKLEDARELAKTSEAQKSQLEALEERMRFAEVQGKIKEAYVLDAIGALYKNLGQPKKALTSYQQALAIYTEFQTPEARGLRRSEGQSLDYIGMVYADMGQYEKALESYQQALTIHREFETWSLGYEEQTLDHIGEAYEKQSQYEKAVEFHQQALEIARKSRVPERIWHNNHATGRSLFKLGKYPEALKHYERAMDMIEALRAELTEKEYKFSFMRDRFYVYDELIELLLTLHREYPDKGYDRKALEIFERKQGRVFLEEIGQSGARFFAGLPEAVSEQERELEIQLDQTRQQLADERAKLFIEQDETLLQHLEQREKTLLSEQDALRNTIKTEYPDYYALRYPHPVALSDLQTMVLRLDELMLVYGVMKEKTCLWVIGQKEFGLYSLDIGEDALAEKVAAFRKALYYEWAAERGLDIGDQEVSEQTEKKLIAFVQASHKLYTLLIPKAVRPLLTDQHTLNIVPTGPLYALPFEALITRPAKDAKKAHYLIEDIPISYLSSASLLKTLREAQARRTTPARYPLLAFAHPAYKRETPQESESVRALRSQSYRDFFGGKISELPETADEVRAIADLLEVPEESTPLQLRENASCANVFAFKADGRLDDYEYLVFAMHGVMPGEAGYVTQSALVLCDDFLTMTDVFGLQLNARLVSLSACNTGRGFQVKGEGVIGLTRAFMYAGTPAVAVTLWSVESFSAKDLDIGFFRHLKDGLPPVRALQAIKLQMLRGEESGNYRHPYYWAPFVVFGDGM